MSQLLFLTGDKPRISGFSRRLSHYGGLLFILKKTTVGAVAEQKFLSLRSKSEGIEPPG